LHVPGQEIELTISPFVLDQEMNLSYRYWEGAVSIDGRRAGVNFNGFGYVEMTGYAGSFEGEF
jgi:predicted secreted hydrolase